MFDVFGLAVPVLQAIAEMMLCQRKFLCHMRDSRDDISALRTLRMSILSRGLDPRGIR